jgi:hypothetical protein
LGAAQILNAHFRASFDRLAASPQVT